MSPLDELLSSQTATGDVALSQMERPPMVGEFPAQTRERQMREDVFADTRQKQDNLIRGEDLKSRGIPSYRDAVSGNVTPVTDETGAALTNYDKSNGIGYDSQGAPKAITFTDAVSPPKLQDPFSGLPTTTDKTGNQYKIRSGLPWQWQGRDENVAAASAQGEKDKATKQYAETLGRKLTLDERDVLHGHKDYEAGRKELLGVVPTLQDPKYAGADLPTVLSGIDSHFNAQYAAPEANATKGWFGDELSPEAAARRTEIDRVKANAYQKAHNLFAMQGTLNTKAEAVATAREQAGAMATQRTELARQKLEELGIAPEEASPQQIEAAHTEADQDLGGALNGAQGQTPAPGLPSTGGILPHETSVPPTIDQAVEDAKAGNKSYSVSGDGSVQFKPEALVAGFDQAIADGLIDEKWGKEHRDDIQKAQDKYDELQAAAGSHQVLKALLHGGGMGAAFLAGAAPGSALGAAGGAAIGGPAAPVTAAIGGILGGLATGALASFAARKGMDKLAEYSDLVKGLTKSAELHPIADAAGEFVAFGASAPKALSKLYRLGTIAGESAAEITADGTKIFSKAAAARIVGKQLGIGALTGAAFEAGIRPAFDLARYAAADALGIEHDKVQAPTAGSLLQMVALGVLTAGHNIAFKDYSAAEVASIVGRGKLRTDLGISFGDKLTPEQKNAMAQAAEANGMDVDSGNFGAILTPLTPAEINVHQTLAKKVEAMEASGAFNDASAKITGAKQALVPGLPGQEGTPIASVGIEAVERGGEPPAAASGPAPTPELPSGGAPQAPAPEPVEKPAKATEVSGRIKIEKGDTITQDGQRFTIAKIAGGNVAFHPEGQPDAEPITVPVKTMLTQIRAGAFQHEKAGTEPGTTNLGAVIEKAQAETAPEPAPPEQKPSGQSPEWQNYERPPDPRKPTQPTQGEQAVGSSGAGQQANETLHQKNSRVVIEALRKSNPGLLERVADLHAEDKTAQEISKLTGVDASTIRDIRSGLNLPSQGKASGFAGAGKAGISEAEDRAAFENWRDQRKKLKEGEQNARSNIGTQPQDEPAKSEPDTEGAPTAERPDTSGAAPQQPRGDAAKPAIEPAKPKVQTAVATAEPEPVSRNVDQLLNDAGGDHDKAARTAQENADFLRSEGNHASASVMEQAKAEIERLKPAPIKRKDEDATTTGQKPQNDQPQHPGIPSGTNLPADPGQVRPGQGESAGGSGGAGQGAQVQTAPQNPEPVVRQPVSEVTEPTIGENQYTKAPDRNATDYINLESGDHAKALETINQHILQARSQGNEDGAKNLEAAREIILKRSGESPIDRGAKPSGAVDEGAHETAKEPWQKTLGEALGKRDEDVDWVQNRDPNTPEGQDHRAAVEKAIEEGKPVPKNVLKDYPWLEAKRNIKPYVESLRGMSDKELKVEEKRASAELNKWASDTPALLPDGRVNPLLGKVAGHEISEKFNAVNSEIEARKATSGTQPSTTKEAAHEFHAGDPVKADEGEGTIAFVRDEAVKINLKDGLSKWIPKQRVTKLEPESSVAPKPKPDEHQQTPLMEGFAGSKAVERTAADRKRGERLETSVPHSFSDLSRQTEPGDAKKVALVTFARNKGFFQAIGINKLTFATTGMESGIEYRPGTHEIVIDTEKAAVAMDVIRHNTSDPMRGRDWLVSIIGTHEPIHAAQGMVADNLGVPIATLYTDGWTDADLPKEVHEIARNYYGEEQWDALPQWKQRAEAVRMIIEVGWRKQTSEQIYTQVEAVADIFNQLLEKHPESALLRRNVELTEDVLRETGAELPKRKGQSEALPPKQKQTERPRGPPLSASEQAVKDSLGDLLGAPSPRYVQDMEQQANWLEQQAHRRKYETATDLALGEPDTFTKLAKGWRKSHPIKAEDAKDDLLGAPNPIQRRYDAEIPHEKLAAIIPAVVTLAKEAETPEKFAISLLKMGAKAPAYSQALWFFANGAGAKGDPYPDWNGIYSSLDAKPSSPSLENFKPTPENLSNYVRDALLAGDTVNRRFISELVGGKLGAKSADEAAEFGIVKAARSEISKGGTPKEIFNRLVELHSRQPNLTAKTSESKVKQQYSTPAPIAYLADILADVNGGQMIYEPTAGNGMLLIGVDDLSKVTANEIDPTRFANLEQLGVGELSRSDATTHTLADKPDRVVENPPFGSVMEADGKNKTFVLPGSDTPTTQIDHAIALQSLQGMTDDGRAVLILGGKQGEGLTRADKYIGGQQGAFWNTLYDKFGVVDHFTINGDLYAKQGAGWPIDMVVIQGRNSSGIRLPSAQGPRILNSWEELSNELDRTDSDRKRALATDAERDADSLREILGGVQSAGQSEAGSKPEIRSGREPAAVPEVGKPARVGDLAESSSGAVPAGSRGRGAVSASESGAGRGQGEPPERTSDNAGGKPSGSRPAVEEEPKELLQVPYEPQSKAPTLDTLVPVNLKDPTRRALETLQKAVGDLDAFVAQKLAYPKGTDIGKYFGAEQVDAIAAAIHQIEKGGALVVGDQTGVGKGRIAAALLAYAHEQGRIPIFVSKEPKLYAAMLGDLADIGKKDLVPFFTNNDVKFEDELGREWASGAGTSKSLRSVRNGLPAKANMIFTTYAQLNQVPRGFSETPAQKIGRQAKKGMRPFDDRAEYMERIAPEALFVLDESHTAGGNSEIGWRLAHFLQNAAGTYYSSATFAKRPDNMGIYYKTALGKIPGMTQQDLVDAMNQGGTPLQQVVSQQLADSGQYLRRERSFEGIPFVTKVDQSNADRDVSLADEFTKGIRSIMDASKQMDDTINRINTVIRNLSKKIGASSAPKLESTEFGEKVHNFVSQYILATKAKAVADEAIKAITEGVERDGKLVKHKVVIAVQNTMEGPISALRAKGASLNYNSLLQRSVDDLRTIKTGSFGKAKTFYISRNPAPQFEKYSDKDLQMLLIDMVPGVDADGKAIRVAKLNEEVAAEMIRRAINSVIVNAENIVKGLNLGEMSLSPIDYIRQRAEAAGIKTGEITGRGIGIKDGEIYNRSAKERSKAGQLRAMDSFNNGNLDLLVLNQSGSTGISLHASEKFKNKEPRMMIVAQPNLDINEFMQMLGRIHRSGQVEKPYFILLQSALAAEMRVAAILGKKMKKLNANTTSNAKTAINTGLDIPDVLNQYGDQVTYKYLSEDRAFLDMLKQDKLVDKNGNLQSEKEIEETFSEPGQLTAFVTGKMAILPDEEQTEFWRQMTSRYNSLIRYLNDTGQNELAVEAMDIQAHTVESKPFTQGSPNPQNAFEESSNIEAVTAQLGREPETAKDALEMGQWALADHPDALDTLKVDANREIQQRTETARTKSLAKWTDEKESALRRKLRGQYDEIYSALSMLGKPVRIDDGKGMDGYAVVTGFRHDSESTLTPSDWIFSLTINTAKHTLKIPASQFSGVVKNTDPDEFEKSYTETAEREQQRHIITGNLLAAYNKLSDRSDDAEPVKGKIIHYTTDRGATQTGILMPLKFSASLANPEVTGERVENPGMVTKALKSGGTVQSKDKRVKITLGDNRLELRVPASRAKGGEFWRHPQLNGMMSGGQFIEKGGWMIGQIGDINSVLKFLNDNEVTLYAKLVDDALGATNPIRKFYDDDVAPLTKGFRTGFKESWMGIKHILAPTTDQNPLALDAVMEMKGGRDRAEFVLEKTLEAAQKGFDQMPRDEQVDFIDRVKTGRKQTSPELQTIADTLREIDTQTWQEAVDLGIPLKWLDDHYRVMWKVIPGSDVDKKMPPGAGRRPLQGSKGMLKRHTLEDMSEGIDMGGVPFSYNPIVMFKMAQADLRKLITARRMWQWAKDHKFARFSKGKFPKLEPGFDWIDDNISRVYFQAESKEGLVEPGRWMVEKGMARLLNNFLSKDFVRTSSLGKSLMWVKNVTTAMELSLSPFHGVFETLETIASSMGLGLQKLTNRGLLGGDAKAAFEGMKDIVTSVTSPYTNATLGTKIIKLITKEDFINTPEGKDFLKQFPDASAMVDDLFAGGAKLSVNQDWKINSIRSFVDSINSQNYIGATLRAFPAANEMLMKPLFEHYIPRLKLAVFFREYANALAERDKKYGGVGYYIDRAGKRWDAPSRSELARQEWRFVEDRFGEMNFDNLFWNRTFKSGMQLMFRSVTWKLGSVSAFSGAFHGQGKEFVNAFRERRAPELHRNMAWLLGVSLLTAALGTIIQKIFTNEYPQNLTDLVFPKIDPKDEKIRVGLPTYIKDAVHLMHSPVGYVKSSMAGWIGRVAEMWTNQDYYGVQVRNTDDPITTQAIDLAKHTGESLLPFSIRGYKNLSDQHVSQLRRMLSFLGTNPAPRYVSSSPLEKELERYSKEHRDVGGQSPEQFETMRAKHGMVEAIRHGQDPGISAAITKGTIKPDKVADLYKRAAMSPLQFQFSHLPLADAQRMFVKASPKERAELAGIMSKKQQVSAGRSSRTFTGF